MLFRTHLVIAIFVLFFLLPYFYFSWVFAFVFLLATGFVDIDSKKSKIGNHWYLRPLQWLVSHRGIFHSLISAVLLSGVIYFFFPILGIGFFLGYVLHLFIDSLTSQGVKLFYPISNFKISFGIKSGGIIEEVVFVLFLLSDLWLTWRVFA